MNHAKFVLLSAIVVSLFSTAGATIQNRTQQVAERVEVVTFAPSPVAPSPIENRSAELAAVDVGLPPESSFEREPVDEYKVAHDAAVATKAPLVILVSDNTLHPVADKAVVVNVLSKYRKELDEQWGDGEKLLVYRLEADGAWSSKCYRDQITPEHVDCWLAGTLCRCESCKCQACESKPVSSGGCRSCRRISYREPQKRGNDKIDAALAEAKQADKKVLAIFGMVGCEPCRKLKAELDKEPAKSALQKFALVYLDSQEDHPAFDRYRVRVCPTTMILDPGIRGIGRSKAIKTATGFMTAGDLALWLKP